jgi:sigma-E factor negative regulatory protein RseA
VGFATLAAVSVITWTATGSAGLSTTSPQLAESRDASQVLVASPQGAIVRDARLNELLAAHKQLGSMSALNAPSGLLQSAAFETSTGNGR